MQRQNSREAVVVEHPNRQSSPSARGPSPTLGPEGSRVDGAFEAAGIDPEVRAEIWGSAKRILQRGPTADLDLSESTGIAIGYVQSGKTTSFTALTAMAADSGYR